MSGSSKSKIFISTKSSDLNISISKSSISPCYIQIEGIMICEMDITWTRRTARKPSSNSEVSFEVLLQIIMVALEPFDEARIVLSKALAEYRPDPTPLIYEPS